MSVFLFPLLIAFVGRVIGQGLVVFAEVTWLPPMSEWMSGLMPYPYLLPSQIVIITLYSAVCVQLWRGEGYFVVPHRWFRRELLVFGVVYFAAMVVRYIVRMAVVPEARWFGGTIPIFFHWVLASFIIVFALWHRARVVDAHR